MELLNNRTMEASLIIHGHFYQPPRENPWTATIDREPSAHPYHDWNERIHHECYRSNAFARIMDHYGRVEAIVNNYTGLSFNFGPTLISWLERNHPSTYQRILEADRISVNRHGGHGNAIAQGYNHVILPLCNERDRVTQVRWGIEDFRHRFGRFPESLWLPETACDDATLGTLIDEGLKYVILSPRQAERVRPLGTEEWIDVSNGTVDSTMPYRYFHRDGSGRSLAIFFYDGEISQSIAFEGLLASSRGLVDRFERGLKGKGRLVHVATDGESYGHHFRLGERGLAFALEREAPLRGFKVTNYGEHLEQHPPAWEAEIRLGERGEGTSWSCVHGVGRWNRDCGCSSGAVEGWHQAWREPLRAALDFLRDTAVEQFEETERMLFIDPWIARDEYIHLLVDRTRSREEFLYRHAGRMLKPAEKVRALTHLEMQRHAMLMYTSCGWFFADVSGIETVQDLKYAGRVLDFMDDLGLRSPRAQFLELLAEAKSNRPEMGNGADIFERSVSQSRIVAPAVASSLAIAGLVKESQSEGEAAGYKFRRDDFRARQHGRLRLATGHFHLESVTTGQAYEYALCAMHFGGVDFYSVLKNYPGGEAFTESAAKVWKSFRAATLPTILRIAQEEFGVLEFGLEHVISDERDRISNIVFSELLKQFTEEYSSIYKRNRRTISMLQEAGFALPEELRAAAEFTLGRRFEEEIRRQQESKDPASYQKAIRIAQEASRRGYHIDRSESRKVFSKMISGVVAATIVDPSPSNVEAAVSLINLTAKLGIDADIEQAQEAIYLALAENLVSPSTISPLALRAGLSPGIIARAVRGDLIPEDELPLTDPLFEAESIAE
jgi:alpha-amylase/alpha-mannosidase (GH57 family)